MGEKIDATYELIRVWIWPRDNEARKLGFILRTKVFWLTIMGKYKMNMEIK